MKTLKSMGYLKKEEAELAPRNVIRAANREKQHQDNIKKIQNIPKSCDHDLVIFESGSQIHVYVTTKECSEAFNSGRNPDPHLKCIDSMLISKSFLNTFKSDLLKNIRNDDEVGVKNLGIQLGKFIPKNIQAKLKEELQNDDNKIKNVWIFCEENDIDYLWEWIYCEEKDFFWGKKFHICRIPNDRISKGGLKPQNIEVKQYAFISPNNCQCGYKDKNCFNSTFFSLRKALNNIRNLNGVDCMHFVAKIDIYQENRDIYESCEDAFKALGYYDQDNKYKIKFLFLNIRIPENFNDYKELIESPEYKLRLLELKDLFTRSAEIWIDTNLDLPDDLALNFSNDFYIELKNGRKTIPEVLTEARKKGNEFCRLAYVVKGNPSTTVSWTAS